MINVESGDVEHTLDLRGKTARKKYSRTLVCQVRYLVRNGQINQMNNYVIKI